MTTPTKVILAGELTTLTIGSAVGQLLSIDTVGSQKAKVSTTALGDTVKNNRLSSMEDVKDTKVQVEYSPTAHSTLMGWLDSTTPTETVVIALLQAGSSTAAATFTNSAAYCTEWAVSGIKEDGNVLLDITIAYNAAWVQS
jgi:ABC-type taurine transport system substrate-binding protein